MSDQYSATCLCGAVNIKFDEPGTFAVKCYCRDCQHISGGGHLPQLLVKREGLEISGPLTTYHYTSDDGNDVTTNFCKTCGSPLFKTTAKMDDKVFIVAGALKDPDIFNNPKNVFEDRMQKWDKSS